MLKLASAITQRLVLSLTHREYPAEDYLFAIVYNHLISESLLLTSFSTWIYSLYLFQYANLFPLPLSVYQLISSLSLTVYQFISPNLFQYILFISPYISFSNAYISPSSFRISIFPCLFRCINLYPLPLSVYQFISPYLFKYINLFPSNSFHKSIYFPCLFNTLIYSFLFLWVTNSILTLPELEKSYLNIQHYLKAPGICYVLPFSLLLLPSVSFAKLEQDSRWCACATDFINLKEIVPLQSIDATGMLWWVPRVNDKTSCPRRQRRICNFQITQKLPDNENRRSN